MNRRIFLSPPHMSGYEQRYIKEAFESNYIAPLGPQVDAFEREFTKKTGISHAVALSSGTAAMHLALCELGVGGCDEVIISTLTFIGSVSPVTFLGAKPVFIDADDKTWNMDPDLLAKKIDTCAQKSQLPKAVVPTDLYGQCADLDRILEICRPYGIPVVVDAAEALGATYKGRSAGKGAKATVFSFNGNKIITTSGGGMLASENEEFIAKARFLSQQARDAAPHFEHSQIGFNYRMSNILAAIGRGQLQVLDERVRVKRQIFAKYRAALQDVDGIEFMPEAPYGKSNRWLTVILISPEKFGTDRETVRVALAAENIEARPVWKPMHMQPVFSGAKCIGGKVAEDLFKRGLCLPSGTAMTDEDMNRIISVILSCRNHNQTQVTGILGERVASVEEQGEVLSMDAGHEVLAEQESLHVNSIFQQHWWLDAVAPNRWHVVEVNKGAEIKARLPYVVRKGKLGLTMLTMPKLTQTLGPWLASSMAKYTKRLSQQKELMMALIEQLPPFDYFLQNFHYSITNWLPFNWQGFQQTTLYTYIITNLTDLDRVFSEFSHSKRKNIKKAKKIVEVRQDLPCKEFYDNHVMTLKKQNQKISYSYEVFNRIYNACYKRSAAKIFYAVDKDNNKHSAIFTIWDKNSAYYLISTIDPDFRNSGSASLLIWEALKFLADKTRQFDFEGSMVPGVERSFRRFGAKQIPYFRVTRMSRRMRKLTVGRDFIMTLIGR